MLVIASEAKQSRVYNMISRLLRRYAPRNDNNKKMQKIKRMPNKIFPILSAGFFMLLAQTQTAFGQWDKSKLGVTKLSSTDLGTIIQNIAMWLLGIFGFIAIIGFVISGITYFVAAGDEDLQEKAKRAMYYSITGVIVGLIGLVVIYAIDSLLGGSAGAGAGGTLSPTVGT